MSVTFAEQVLKASSVDRAPRRRSTVRLTRRGRVVVFVLALLVLMAIGLVGASISGASQEKGSVATHTVVVGTGDTLWELASDAADGGDIRRMEQTIKDLNGLDSGMLIAGQTLRIPN